jgi:hypothetical protein
MHIIQISVLLSIDIRKINVPRYVYTDVSCKREKMQRLTIIIIIMTVFFGCINQSEKKTDSVIEPDSISKIDTITDTIFELKNDTFSVPTKQFIEIVAFLDSSNFVPDTARIKGVGYYWQRIKTNEVIKINSIPFFKMDTLTNPVFEYLYRNANNKYDYPENSRNYWERNISKQIINNRIFHRVESITGLFFRDKNIPDVKNGELWTDGFIEEWKFESIEDAIKAEETLKNDNLYYLIYFNSIAFVNRNENYLYTYYSRSCWADRRLENFFKEIIEIQNKKTPAVNSTYTQ